MKVLKRIESGKVSSEAVCLKNIGGRRSGPAAELDLSLLSEARTIVGVILISLRPGFAGPVRAGKDGVCPLS